MRRPLLALLAVGTLAAGLTFGPSATAAPFVDPLGYGFQGEGGLDAETLDQRVGAVLPTPAQRAAVAALGARATWDRLGSPKVLTRDDAEFLSEALPGTPADAARAFVRRHAVVFGLSEGQTSAEQLELVKAVPLTEGPQARKMMARESVDWSDNAHVVSFRQRYAGRPAAIDGQLTVALDKDNRVAFVSSSVTGRTAVTNTARISMVDAYLAAAKDARIAIDRDSVELLEAVTPQGARVLKRAGVADQQTVRLVAVPTPTDGIRLAYEAVVLRSLTDGVEHPHAYLSMVDAQTGKVLHRSNRLQHLAEAGAEDAPGAGSVPYWKVFPNFPDLPIQGTVTPDNREFWCFTGGTDCSRVLGPVGDVPNVASPYAYDENLLADGTPVPTNSTDGNNARTAISRVSQLTPDTAVPAVSATREYDFPFTDQWQQSKCDPTNFASPELNDADAATANLFVMHNRMHDWGYFLGWTEVNSNFQKENAGSEADSADRENDPEIGNSQSGSIAGGATFLGRDNANQVTLNDGTPGISNQYLWEPLQSGFYPPCVDGAYDMGIVGHEVGHGIQNRMTANSNGLSGDQSSSMGESWSDLSAMEYLNGYGYQYGTGLQRYSIAAYAVGDAIHGIRNFNMADSPLNYSDIDYDGNGTTSPHADGEIWSATQFDVRAALVKKWESQYDSDDQALQARCAEGLLPSTQCPGNRRWIQLIHDGFLLQPSSTSMLDSRDAILAADKARYNGANTKELWAAFAKRGMGTDAEAMSANDHEVEGGFQDPVGSNGKIVFKATGTGATLPEEIKVHVGAFEARTTPVAVLAGATPSAARSFTPGTYRLYVVAEGFGHLRTTMTVTAGGTKTVTLPLRANLASGTNGAEATGDGGGLEFLIDDSEGTNWASIGEGDIRGKQVTVDLAGGQQTVREVQVSAVNRPALCDGPMGDNPTETVPGFCSDGDDAPYDTGGQNRFAALRSFEILTCDTTTGSACEEEGDFTSRLVAKDAFPADRPRPTVKDLMLRTFAIPETKATHVRIKVLDNQCTGGPDYTGAANPENNPLSDPDCANGALTTASAAGAPATTTNNTQVQRVRIAELQVFSSRTGAAPVVVTPPVVTPPTAGPTLPTTGGLPLALLGLGLLVGAGAVVRARRTA